MAPLGDDGVLVTGRAAVLESNSCQLSVQPR
jgi:hypothetical protein